ncbi:hypothetical protein [Pseudooceanicola lipolyticus]|uniref:hypothetical protein n=1 Tax=Pseudooceanicola lipolyticus TaxID=2029104 RepID=UPI000C1E50C5|nr:hypothetical protein [Pseudooceanicola lipolyticus]
MASSTFATLGPEGSNHHLVLQAYLEREEIAATPLLCDDFGAVLQACTRDAADHIFICAAHGRCGEVVGAAQYKLGLKITDVFVAESQPLAILHRKERPRSIALHPATREYASLSAYEEVIEVSSTVAAAEGLRAGAWDAALTATRFAGDGLTIARHIPPPRDAWLVLGGVDRSTVWKLG